MGNYFRPVDLDAIVLNWNSQSCHPGYADSFESDTLEGLDFMRSSLERCKRLERRGGVCRNVKR
jgi:hypothetical protein